MGLLSPAELVLIDEPFEGLDLRQRRDAARGLRAEVHRGRTLFLSIHQINDAARLCDRFVLLDHGRVTAVGTRDDLAAAAVARGQVLATGDLEDIFLALT
jgi:ABC-2 type transport system ATP-binding protein